MDEAMLKSGQYPNIAIEAGTDPAEVMREHGRVDNGAEADTREKLNEELMDSCLTFANGGGHLRAFAYVSDLLDRQAAITRAEVDEMRDCADCSEGMLANMQQQVDELTAERDELQAKVDELNANWRKANDGWAEANAEAERLQHANNTLRASVAGLKMTVERFKARESRDARQSG